MYFNKKFGILCEKTIYSQRCTTPSNKIIMEVDYLSEN